MKALVLSGGYGIRFRPFSYSMPKQLFPIANKPVLEYVIESIREIGVREIGIIVGDHSRQIAERIGDGSTLGVRVTYIPQERPLGLAHCVAISRPFLGADDFVMYLGDNLLPEGIADAAAQFAAARPAAQLVVQKAHDPRRFGVVELGLDGTVLDVVEKPSQPRSELALIGVYFFTAEIHKAVAATLTSARGELEITDAIQVLVRSGARVTAYRYEGLWKDTGTADDVLECNRLLLGAVQRMIAGDTDQFSELHGPVVLGQDAQVRRSQIVGPVVIGAGSLIEDSFIGPGTSIGQNCELRDVGVSNSIILDNAVVSGIRDISHSLIGRYANVGSGEYELPGHKLLLGDHASIRLPVRGAR